MESSFIFPLIRTLRTLYLVMNECSVNIIKISYNAFCSHLHMQNPLCWDGHSYTFKLSAVNKSACLKRKSVHFTNETQVNTNYQLSRQQLNAERWALCAFSLFSQLPAWGTGYEVKHLWNYNAGVRSFPRGLCTLPLKLSCNTIN